MDVYGMCIGIVVAAILLVMGFGAALEYRDECRRSGLSAQERRQYRRMRKHSDRRGPAYTYRLCDVIGDDEEGARI